MKTVWKRWYTVASFTKKSTMNSFVKAASISAAIAICGEVHKRKDGVRKVNIVSVYSGRQQDIIDCEEQEPVANDPRRIHWLKAKGK